jgi:hypothetical protein
MAALLKVSVSRLAKARMRGEEPDFHKLNERTVRYGEAGRQTMESRRRHLTSETSVHELFNAPPCARAGRRP